MIFLINIRKVILWKITKKYKIIINRTSNNLNINISVSSSDVDEFMIFDENDKPYTFSTLAELNKKWHQYTYTSLSNYKKIY